MTVNENRPNSIPFKRFTASTQAAFFDKLKQTRFTGRLLLTGPRNMKWVFYLYLGRIVYATGGYHPVRRWRRHLMAYLPHLPSNFSAHKGDLDSLNLEDTEKCWEYELLCLWVEQQKVSLEQAAKLIRHNIIEVIFDITQAMQVTCQLKPDKSAHFSSRLVLIDAEQVILASKKLWLAWQSAKIADRSPDMAPIITQPEELEKQTKPQIYKTLKQLLDGQQSLRDLSIRMNRDVLTLTKSLLPYVQRGLIRFIEIKDIPSPVKPPDPASNEPKKKTKMLIACVDDSPLICQTMEKIIKGAGFDFVGINDALRAIAILLSKKPDLIFLDLVMPNANGYEICSQLRKLTFFKHTPIVILTGNDGLVDRVRAKMVGSTDFIGKPVDTALVLDTIKKHLNSTVS